MDLLCKFKKLNSNKPRLVFVEAVSAKRSSAVMRFIMQLLLLFVCLVGFVYCISTSLQSDIPLWLIGIISLPVITVAALLTLNVKVYISFLSVFSLTLALIFTVFKDLSAKIIESFIFCYNRTIQIVVDEGYVNYESSMTEDITEKLADSSLVNEYYYCVVIFLIIVFSVIFTSSMMKKSLVWLCSLPCFLMLTPSLYFGAVPSGAAFAIFISGIIGCYVESLSAVSFKQSKKDKKQKLKKDKKQKYSSVNKSAIGGFANTLIILMLSLTISVFVYSSDILRLDKFREVIDDVAMHIMNALFYEQYETAEGAIGGLIENDTLDLKTPEFRDLPVMDLTTRTNSPLYLRGWIGKNINEQGWKVLDGEDTESYNSAVPSGFQPYTQFYNFMTLMSTNELENAESAKDTQKLGFVYDTVRIKARFSKSSMVFIPMTGIDGKINGDYSGIETVGDTISFFENGRPKNNTYEMNSAVQSFATSNFYVNLKKKQSDYLSYASKVSLNLTNPSASEAFIIGERKYTEYVKDTYLDTPDGTEKLAELAREITKEYTHSFDKALSIERYLKTNYQYSIETAAPQGTPVQKINYVIEQGKSGYCTYFASAMTLMMRELGIPARYVVGYYSRIPAEDGSAHYNRAILDKNYHAWVEVYLEGVGWLTFDPTPGYGNNAPLRNYDYLDQDAPTVEQPTDAPEPEPSPPVTEIAPEEVNPDLEPDTEDAVDLTQLFIILGSIVLGLLIIFGIIVTFKLINSRYARKVKGLRELNITVMTRKIYPMILKLHHGLGFDILPGELVSDYARRIDSQIKLDVEFSAIVDKLEMSHFSQNDIRFEDAKLIYGYYLSLSAYALKKFNFIKKYYYKIILAK